MSSSGWFALELIGTYFHARHEPEPGCDECRRVYADLYKVATFILPKEHRKSRCEVAPFDGKLTFAPRHGLRKEVVLTIRVVHGDDYRQPIDECQNVCLMEMERKLKELGARG